MIDYPGNVKNVETHNRYANLNLDAEDTHEKNARSMPDETALLSWDL
jgi:hypothetical protein